MSTEKKMGHDHEYECFWNSKFEVCFFDGMISYAIIQAQLNHSGLRYLPR